MDILIPKVPEVFVSLVSFLVLFFVLAKFAFPPITKMLDDRAEKIRDSLAAAQRLLAERFGIDHVTLQPDWRAPTPGKRVIPVTPVASDENPRVH